MGERNRVGRKRKERMGWLRKAGEKGSRMEEAGKKRWGKVLERNFGD
jgi:hypothetical protein